MGRGAGKKPGKARTEPKGRNRVTLILGLFLHQIAQRGHIPLFFGILRRGFLLSRVRLQVGMTFGRLFSTTS